MYALGLLYLSCLAHILVWFTCLLYKDILVYVITWEIQYNYSIFLKIVNKILERVLINTLPCKASIFPKILSKQGIKSRSIPL